jgi:hypothetical protein
MGFDQIVNPDREENWMRKSIKRTAAAAVLGLAALLTVGVVAASAHGGPGGPGGRGIGGGSVSSLVTQAAKELGITRAKLVTAIQGAAADRIDASVDDGDLSDARGDDLKEEAADNLSVAYSLSETKTVASKLGITTAALNTGFKAARKALATAKIDAALAAGDITSDEATSLKAKLTDANLSGYKGGLGFGLGGGHAGGRR